MGLKLKVDLDKIQTMTEEIKKAGCFVGDLKKEDAICLFTDCIWRQHCMWAKDRADVRGLGRVEDNRGEILRR